MKALCKSCIVTGLFLSMYLMVNPTLGFGQEQPKKPYVHKKSSYTKKLKNPMKKKAKVTKDLRFEKIN